MGRNERTIAELRRRVQLMPAELAAWKAVTKKNAGGMGIHKTQIAAVNLMFEELIATHEDLLGDLKPTLDAGEFKELCSDLAGELSGAHGLMAVFRHILAQRLETERYRAMLDAADLIAADCYRPYVQKAQDWEVLGKQQFREPPLTFLNARSSPAAITRRHTFAGLGFDLESYSEKALPISVISLRFHDTAALWSFSSIYHEAGHLLEQDLGLTKEVGTLLANALQGSADQERLTLWKFWTREMLADAFGVLLGGAGFAHELAHLLLLPDGEVLQIQPGDKHPVPYVRIFLLGALLRQTGVQPLVEAAGEIEGAWQESYGAPPAGLAFYLQECKIVSRVLLDTFLAQRLKNRRLLDFAADLAGDHRKAWSLAEHLRDDKKAPRARGFPVRLVPAAASLAAHTVTQDYDQAYADIQKRTLAFMTSLPRPKYMAGPGAIEPDREQYLRQQARNLRFSRS